MPKPPDRRVRTEKGLPSDRRKGERRKSNPISEDTPIRRDEDWNKIDSELKDQD